MSPRHTRSRVRQVGGCHHRVAGRTLGGYVPLPLFDAGVAAYRTGSPITGRASAARGLSVFKSAYVGRYCEIHLALPALRQSESLAARLAHARNSANPSHKGRAAASPELLSARDPAIQARLSGPEATQPLTGGKTRPSAT